jgi:hypothetical protein
MHVEPSQYIIDCVLLKPVQQFCSTLYTDFVGQLLRFINYFEILRRNRMQALLKNLLKTQKRDGDVTFKLILILDVKKYVTSTCNCWSIKTDVISER